MVVEYLSKSFQDFYDIKGTKRRFTTPLQNGVVECMNCTIQERVRSMLYNAYNFYDTKGTKRGLTTPYTPQQNGVVEHMNCTIQERVRSMLSKTYQMNLG